MKRIMAFLMLLLLSAAGASAEEGTGRKMVRFGHYEQNSIPEDGPEEIEWIVLREEEGASLLISRFGLEVLPYHETYGDITWEECSLRAWLNGEFLSAAFTEGERKAILLHETDNGPAQNCAGYGTDGGRDTRDLVFLLSYAEAEAYFPDDAARQCSPTAYALSRGAHHVMHAGRLRGLWWLRSPGNCQYRVSVVYSGGMLNYTYASKASGCVRPVILADTELLKAGDQALPHPLRKALSSSRGTCMLYPRLTML